MKPFRIDIPDEVLDDLRARLARTRWPNQLEGAGWDYGTELGYLQDLCGTWRDVFDWRAQEARLNQWEQFTTEIDGERELIESPATGRRCIQVRAGLFVPPHPSRCPVAA